MWQVQPSHYDSRDPAMTGMPRRRLTVAENLTSGFVTNRSDFSVSRPSPMALGRCGRRAAAAIPADPPPVYPLPPEVA